MRHYNEYYLESLMYDLAENAPYYYFDRPYYKESNLTIPTYGKYTSSMRCLKSKLLDMIKKDGVVKSKNFEVIFNKLCRILDWMRSEDFYNINFKPYYEEIIDLTEEEKEDDTFISRIAEDYVGYILQGEKKEFVYAYQKAVEMMCGTREIIVRDISGEQEEVVTVTGNTISKEECDKVRGHFQSEGVIADFSLYLNFTRDRDNPYKVSNTPKEREIGDPIDEPVCDKKIIYKRNDNRRCYNEKDEFDYIVIASHYEDVIDYENLFT